MKSTNNVSIGQAKRYRIIMEYIQKYNPVKVLEIGSGSQGIGRCYNIKFDGLDLTTSDYTGEEKNHNENMTFINGSALNIPIGDNTYDFVFSTDMIEHIKKNDREKVFKEAIRVCKKGGYILFTFPCGICGKLSDIFIFCFCKILSFIYRKNMIPGWLKEHLSIDYPKGKDISSCLKRIINEEHLIKNYKIHNLFINYIHSLLDFTNFSIKNRIIDRILNGKHTESGSFFGVRKLILIKK